jgi:hypothetical protein
VTADVIVATSADDRVVLSNISATCADFSVA